MVTRLDCRPSLVPVVLLIALLALPTPAPAAKQPEGVLPKGIDGHTLNLDFETGDLRDWQASGAAFRGQPVRGDTVHRRRSDMRSRHQGAYWVGTYEVAGDQPQGVLVSAPFKVTHRWASFLVGGGSHRETRVELVLQKTGKVIFQASGRNREDMHRVAVDLEPYLGQTIFIRVVDKHSGHWGHINFDDFRFHEQRPEVGSGEGSNKAFLYQGLDAERAARAMNIPEGFEVRVFAAEPDVRQPIAFTIDERGRLWVVEAYTYPIRQPEGQGRDRILIFTDRDGDGRFDERKVFAEGLNLVSGIEVGFGGVWVGAAPYLLFIPDRNRDDVPDGDPIVVLDGWGYQDTHETLNAFIWGPDGWLYGCHGVFTHSAVGKPGTPADQRVKLNAALWRYHPLKQRFEVFAYGTSNPWGVDFDDYGQAFITACVIPHLYHMILGGRYQRQAGRHFNPYVYDDIKTIADHLHYTGSIREHAHWGHEPITPASVAAAGGGHAHAGAMVYLGDSWPSRYRGKLFMNNIHGARVNMDILEPNGSGFVGRHGPDFIVTNDYWSQMLYLRYGPDGHVFVNDWYDRNQCHRTDPNVHDRSNGRIYKVVYKPNEVPHYDHPLFESLIRAYREGRLDLTRLSDEELVELQLHPNDWYVRTARRLLQERGAKRQLSNKAIGRLKQLTRHADPRRRLRAAWVLHACGLLDANLIRQMLADDNPYVRGWAVQLLTEDGSPGPDWLHRLGQMATQDDSPIVRLYLASAAQRIPVADRWTLLEPLLAHSEDASDHNLPLMYWFAFEPAVADKPERALALVRRCELDRVVQFTYRRVADIGTTEAFELIARELKREQRNNRRIWMLSALEQALRGRRRAPLPPSWTAVSPELLNSSDATVRQLALTVAVTFGDPFALSELRKTLRDRTRPLAARQSALTALSQVRDTELLPILLHLVRSEAGPLRQQAIRSLAAFSEPQVAETLLELYPRLSPVERRAALATLSSRLPWARALVEAVAADRIPRTDLTADLVRQLRNVADEALAERLRTVWGVVRKSPAEKAALMERYRKLLTDRSGPAPDVNLGRAVFDRTCAQCHTLYGVGGDVGPDLTGSNRADLDYALSNVIDPSAVMAKEYVPHIILTADGRIITGIVKQQSERTVTVQTADEVITLPRDEIEAMKQSEQSMMPDDLLQQLSEHEVRSLFAYLATTRQVPALATPQNVTQLLAGSTLTHWLGNKRAWHAEGGTLVGKAPEQGEAAIWTDMVFDDFTATFEYEFSGTGRFVLFVRAGTSPDGKLTRYEFELVGPNAGTLTERGGRGVLVPGKGTAQTRGRVEVRVRGARTTIQIDGRAVLDFVDAGALSRGAFGLAIEGAGSKVTVRRLTFDLDGRTGGGRP